MDTRPLADAEAPAKAAWTIPACFLLYQCLVRVTLVSVRLGFRASPVLITTPTPCEAGGASNLSVRKEVIQPQVPLRLPCYDLVPITSLALGAVLLTVGQATSSTPRFRGLTGGVYKAQEHIHRGMADPRLLAIPAS